MNHDGRAPLSIHLTNGLQVAEVVRVATRHEYLLAAAFLQLRHDVRPEKTYPSGHDDPLV